MVEFIAGVFIGSVAGVAVMSLYTAGRRGINGKTTKDKQINDILQ